MSSAVNPPGRHSVAASAVRGADAVTKSLATGSPLSRDGLGRPSRPSQGTADSVSQSVGVFQLLPIGRQQHIFGMPRNEAPRGGTGTCSTSMRRPGAADASCSSAHGGHPAHVSLAALSGLVVVVVLQNVEEQFASGIGGKALKALGECEVALKDGLLGHVLQGVHQGPALAVRPTEAAHDVQHRVDAVPDARILSQLPCRLHQLPEREAGSKRRHAGTLGPGTDNHAWQESRVVPGVRRSREHVPVEMSSTPVTAAMHRERRRFAS